VLTVGLAALALTQLTVGVWALWSPSGFYRDFPSAGHAWVALLPPYNEHLTRDVGALSLALTVLLVVAAVTADLLLVRTTVAAFLVYAIPHTVFHGLHLDGFPAADAIAQMVGFALQLVLSVAVLLATRGGEVRHRSGHGLGGPGIGGPGLGSRS
jgi:hypothetical protein